MLQKEKETARKEYLLLGVSLLSLLASTSSSSAKDFIETWGMRRHAQGGPPPVVKLKELLTTAPVMQYVHDGLLPPSLGGEASVLKAKRMFKVSTGYDGSVNAGYGGGVAQVKLQNAMTMAGGRYVQANGYTDADGNHIDFGYKRDTEHFLTKWRPRPGTMLEFQGMRDAIRDDLQPHSSMDVTRNDRIGGKIALDHKLSGYFLNGFGLELSAKTAERSMDTYKNRVSSQKVRFDFDRKVLEGKGVARLDLIGWKTSAMLKGHWDNHDARRYNDAAGNAITAIKLPDITTQRFATELVGKRKLGGGLKLVTGARYDFVHASPGAVYKTGNYTGSGAAQWNRTPADLYKSYYGVTGDYDRTDHNLSARIRLTQSLANKRLQLYGDISRKVRSPDNTEAYHAMTHTKASKRWIGNPNLAPEAHHKAELGFIWNGVNYKSYGKLSPKAHGAFDFDNVHIKVSGYVDAVDNFITWDRAHGQSGTIASDGALIYRNVDAMFLGANLESRWNIDRHWSAAAQLAYLWGNNDSDDRALYQIAPLETNFLVDYSGVLDTVGAWNAGAKLRLVSDQTRVDTDATTALGFDGSEGEGFATVDLYAGMKIDDSVFLSAGINNLFDADYQEHLVGSHVNSASRTKINAPGRSVFISLKASF